MAKMPQNQKMWNPYGLSNINLNKNYLGIENMTITDNNSKGRYRMISGDR